MPFFVTGDAKNCKGTSRSHDGTKSALAVYWIGLNLTTWNDSRTNDYSSAISSVHYVIKTGLLRI